jgi:protein TonB
MGGVEGYVTIRFTVTDDGTVSNPKVIESRPPRVFDRAALAAIKRWKFRPKFVNGVAVEQNGVQTIEFTIY